MNNRNSTSNNGEGSTGETCFIEAMSGSHLHWSDFRDDVLQPFRIRCAPTAKGDRLPTTFLARLQASQGNLDKYETRKQAWRLDVSTGRGFNTTNIFPPNVLPTKNGCHNILGCMSPKMSRESLPLRTPGSRSSLYELPTAKPSYVYGFDTSFFEKNEQAQLHGALNATGTVIDFDKAEVLLNQSVACPFLAFERVDDTSERSMEAARNACAVTGAQCLRGQQQLFHKAFGLQTISQPPITFTCALSEHQAIVNCHYVDEDGFYTMAALCKFDLDDDTHFKTFQAWIDAIKSWASIYLLPRIKGAIGQVMLSNPSPPPSPAPTNSSHLSIDTTSENITTILNTLRRLWPMIPWHNDMVGETPINSSIAMCGTPLPARQSRGLALPNPPDGNDLQTFYLNGDVRSHSSLSQRPSLTPLHTDIPISARPERQPLHSRRLSSASAISRFGSSTPESPCRPPSLSPCTPGPEMPMSSKSPMLVLQKRLELAMSEIQDLRSQIDDLDGQLNGRTEVIDRRIELITERQDELDRLLHDGGGSGPKSRKVSKRLWVQQLEALVEEDMPTPVADLPGYFEQEMSENYIESVSPTDLLYRMPGHFAISRNSFTSNEGDPWLTEEFVIWCIAMITRDSKTTVRILAVVTTILCCAGVIDASAYATMAVTFVLNSFGQSILLALLTRLTALYEAAQAYDLDGSRVIGVSPDTAESRTFKEAKIVPLVLA